MTTAHKAFEEANERHERLTRRHDRLIPLAAALIAVLAALGTLFAHHRSIMALSLKNDAIITTAKATEQFNQYQTKRVRVAIYWTLLSGEVIKDPKLRANARKSLDHEQASSVAVLRDADALEARAAAELERSEVLMRSFETLEVATTLFEIGIVFSSLAALTENRVLLWMGLGMSAIGIILMAVGFLQGR